MDLSGIRLSRGGYAVMRGMHVTALWRQAAAQLCSAVATSQRLAQSMPMQRRRSLRGWLQACAILPARPLPLLAMLLFAEEEEPQGLAALLPGRQREKRVNIKQRMASILMQVGAAAAVCAAAVRAAAVCAAAVRAAAVCAAVVSAAAAVRAAMCCCCVCCCCCVWMETMLCAAAVRVAMCAWRL